MKSLIKLKNQAPIGLQYEKTISDCVCFFSYLIMVFCLGVGLKLFQNGWLRSPDLLQYFLNDFWNFEMFDQIWTRRPSSYYKNASRNQSKYGNILGNIIVVNMATKKMGTLNVLSTSFLFWKYEYLSFHEVNLWRRGSGKYKFCMNKISRSLDMNFTSIKKH